MATQRRQHRRTFNSPGHAHELTFSCFESLPLLASDRTLEWLAESINRAKIEFGFDVWAYVFMPEHAHLIVRPRLSTYNMSALRRAIKEPVGRKAIGYLKKHSPDYLPRLTRQRGAREERLFWQSGGGYDRNIVTTATLLSAIDYIHMNPVRRNLVARAAEWKWSSAEWFERQAETPVQMDLIPSEWLNESVS